MEAAPSAGDTAAVAADEPITSSNLATHPVCRGTPRVGHPSSFMLYLALAAPSPPKSLAGLSELTACLPVPRRSTASIVTITPTDDPAARSSPMRSNHPVRLSWQYLPEAWHTLLILDGERPTRGCRLLAGSLTAQRSAFLRVHRVRLAQPVVPLARGTPAETVKIDVTAQCRLAARPPWRVGLC